MVGRAPIKVFEYDAEGKYVRTFPNMQECRDMYYPNAIGRMPIFKLNRVGIRFDILENGHFLVPIRMSRNKLVQLGRIYRSEYCTELITRQEKIIQVFNLEGTLLLEARNPNVLSKMTGINQATISSALNSSVKGTPKGEFIFRLKENERSSS